MSEDLPFKVELAVGAGNWTALRQVFRRLEETLTMERDILVAGQPGSLEEVSRRKGLCLRDLGRLSQVMNLSQLSPDDLDDASRADLLHIKSLLQENAAMLERYLAAAQEVSRIVSESVRMAESDGTYAEAGPFGRYGR